MGGPYRGGFGEGADATLQGFYPLPTQRVTLGTILKYPFLAMGPKNFMRAPFAPVRTNLDGKRTPKNAIFWSKFSEKCLKTPFLVCFLKILHAAQKIWQKQGHFSALGELKKSIWST